jgi:hydroxyacylglutathione hydrolase
MEVVRIPVLSDNYVWLLRDGGSGKTAVVDPAEAAPVMKELKSRWGSWN